MKDSRCKQNKLKVKYFIKDIILLVFFACVYAFSVYKNGFKDTNIKLLTLFFYAGIGFLGAIVIYFIVLKISRLISYLNAKKREKLLKKFKIVEITNRRYSPTTNFNNYLFTFPRNRSNLIIIKEDIINILTNMMI